MKILVRIVVALVLLLLLVSGLGIWFIDSLVRKAIEEAGTYALGTPTHLESADVGWTSGRFALAGLEVENPPGFADVPFFALGEGDVELAMQTVSQETIEIPHVGLSGISLSLERNSKGTNYGVLLASLERFESGGGEPSEGAGGEGSAPAGSEKRIMVKKIEIRDVSVTVDLVPEAGELTKTTVTIPSLVLEDVGTAEGGLTVAQLIGRVIRDAGKAGHARRRGRHAGAGDPRPGPEEARGARRPEGRRGRRRGPESEERGAEGARRPAREEEGLSATVPAGFRERG